MPPVRARVQNLQLVSQRLDIESLSIRDVHAILGFAHLSATAGDVLSPWTTS